MEKQTINNVNVDALPEHVQTAILKEFASLDIKEKLIVYSKLIHGHSFKVVSNDLFNITKHMPNAVFSEFLDSVKIEIEECENEYS